MQEIYTFPLQFNILPWLEIFLMYWQTSNISHTLVGNKLVIDVVGSIACRRCSNYIVMLNLTPGLNGLDKDNCKTERETFKFLGLVPPI